MGSLTNYAENAILNHLCTNAAYSPATTLYVALATANPGEAATGASMNEVADSGSYARTAITFGAASSRRVTQNAVITFPTATGPWGTVTHWAIVDNSTHGAGNVLAYGSLLTSKSIVAGNTPNISSGTIYVEIGASGADGGISNYAANGILDRMFRNQTFTVSANYISAHTAACTDSAAGTEVSGGSYARVRIYNQGGGATDWETVSGGATQNEGAVTFPTATASWGSVTMCAIYDASTAGNYLGWCNIPDNTVDDGDTLEFAVGALDWSIS